MPLARNCNEVLGMLLRCQCEPSPSTLVDPLASSAGTPPALCLWDGFWRLQGGV